MLTPNIESLFFLNQQFSRVKTHDINAESDNLLFSTIDTTLSNILTNMLWLVALLLNGFITCTYAGRSFTMPEYGKNKEPEGFCFLVHDFPPCLDIGAF